MEQEGKSMRSLREEEQICGTCKYHRKEGGDWVCANERSENVDFYTGYEDACEDWEGRK